MLATYSVRPMNNEPITAIPEVVDERVSSAPAEVVDQHAAESPAEQSPTESVSQPTKLIRIATMVRSMLEEVRRAPLDDAGRRMLAQVHARSLHELEGILSPDLKEELADVASPLTSETPSESELRVAQAQLVGWLEGLFHGIQATLFTQQSMATQQFEQMRHPRAIESGNHAPPQDNPPGTGVYL